MTPQATLVLKHLSAVSHITGVEAESVHRIRHLPSRIFEIKKAGYSIATEFKRDVTGQRYASYSLVA